MAFYMYIYTLKLIDKNVFIFAVNLRYNLIWFFFSLSWILLIALIYYVLNNKYKLIFYNLISIFWTTMFVVQICYCQEMGKFMVFSDLFVAGEGLQYVGSVLTTLDWFMVLTAVFNVACMIIVNNLLGKELKNNSTTYRNKLLMFLLLIFVVSFRLVAYISLGVESKYESYENMWESNYNAKSIYVNYINPNTSMYVSGLYEYNLRAVYKYYYNLITVDRDALKEEVDVYNSLYSNTYQENDMTGIFEGKNVIYILMESIDSWIIDEDTMPTLKYMQDTGINFTNRYSPFFNGGQTINSEFAMNTGLYAITDYDTIYDIDTVDYNYSLANMLKKKGYSVNSFHANTGKFYNRSNFHKLLGYDNHYSAKDMQDEGTLDKRINYYADSNLISDKTLSKLITGNGKDKFLSFITTYSAHLEYKNFNQIYKLKNGSIENKYDTEEEYIYRTLANDTDQFLKILLDTLEKKGLLDDTVIVLASDHYVYGYSDSDYVAEQKNVVNSRKTLQKTPLIIWSKGITHKNVDTILDTTDILPTLLNMLGIKYNPNNYMGDDVFSSYHDKFVWFSDGSFITSDDNELSRSDMYAKSNLNIIKNRNILLTNYYGK